MNNRIQEIQTGQGRRVQRKERLDIVDEVTQDLLPRAFTKSQYLEGLINDREGWVWVNTASAARAEDFLSLLREGLGNLQVTIPDTQKSPVVAMSQWVLNGGLPEGLSLGGDADQKTHMKRVELCVLGASISSLTRFEAISRAVSKLYVWPYLGGTKWILCWIRT